ncbi:hypothetical protein A2U01_0042077 [Trifolium medium]|uniref:Uncharacterized protein n=1 Tax=Trifolium medium TaxID=97028 RepID=A0A392Q9U8_9FABA|nr:hypothetical protein [Trifolium medium]
MVFPFIALAIECEATALPHALLIAVSCGFERVKSLISSNASYNLAFVWRQVNRVIHSLARASVFQYNEK